MKSVSRRQSCAIDDGMRQRLTAINTFPQIFHATCVSIYLLSRAAASRKTSSMMIGLSKIDAETNSNGRLIIPARPTANLTHRAANALVPLLPPAR